MNRPANSYLTKSRSLSFHWPSRTARHGPSNDIPDFFQELLALEVGEGRLGPSAPYLLCKYARRFGIARI